MPKTATTDEHRPCRPAIQAMRNSVPGLRLLRPVAAIIAVACVLISVPQAATGTGPLTTTVTAETSARSVVVGTEVTISGAVTPTDVDASRAVVLELRTANGWREAGRGSTDLAGTYTLQVPTDWYASHELRVVALGIPIAQAGVSDVQTVAVTPSYQPRGSSSAWKRFPSQARWDPCTVVEYRTNLHRAPKGSLAQIRRAFAVVHAATGLSFRRAGSTNKVPYSRAPEKQQFPTAGLVVAWTTPQVVPSLAGSTAGFGGSTFRSVDGGPWRYIYGGVSIDATQVAAPNGPRTSTLLLHEIGHVMGLTHVSAGSQIMHPYLLPSHRARYEAGDLAGLQALGAEQGCF
jgi:hypothetical protein